MVDGPPQPADADNAKAQQRRRLTWRLAGAGLLVLGLLWVYVFWVPRWMYPSLTDSDLRDVKTAKDKPDAAKIQEFKDARLKLQNDARTTLLQGLGGVLVLTGAGIGAYVAFQQVRATRDQIAQTATNSGNQLELSAGGSWPARPGSGRGPRTPLFHVEGLRPGGDPLTANCFRQMPAPIPVRGRPGSSGIHPEYFVRMGQPVSPDPLGLHGPPGGGGRPSAERAPRSGAGGRRAGRSRRRRPPRRPR